MPDTPNLKPCAHCGEELFDAEFQFMHPKNDCYLSEHEVYLEDFDSWNSRPIEESLQAENERLKDELRRVKKMLVRVIGDHDAPSDCYSTGPLEGNRMDDICPSCEGLHYLNHPDTEKP